MQKQKAIFLGILLSIFWSLGLIIPLQQATAVPTPSPLKSNTFTKPRAIATTNTTLFIQNVGQLNEQIRFQVNTTQATWHFTNDGFWLTPVDDECSEAPFSPIFIQFKNANPNAKVVGHTRLATHLSYFIGQNPSQWHRDVPVYAGVRYQEIYPGIDFLFHHQAGEWQAELIVKEEADTTAVFWQLHNATLTNQHHTTAHITTAMHTFALPWLANTTPTSSNNHLAPSIQQPTLITNTTYITQYSTYLGGTNDDKAVDVAIDANGSAYILGETQSIDFHPTLTNTIGGDQDIFIAKVTPSTNQLHYVAIFGGTTCPSGFCNNVIKEDQAAGIAIDSSGNAYATGTTYADDFPVITGSLDLTLGGSHDAFVVKLDPTGTNILYATYLGGSSGFLSGWDHGHSIAVDQLEQAHITGQTESTDFPIQNPIRATIDSSYNDAFVTKLSSNGDNLIYSTYLGGETGVPGWANEDSGLDITVDNNGRTYVVGTTNATDFPTTPNAYINSFTLDYCGPDAIPCSNGFATKLSITGTLLHATYLNVGVDQLAHRAVSMDIDQDNNHTYVLMSSDYEIYAPQYINYVLKLNTNGTNAIYTSPITSSMDALFGKGIALDPYGRVHIAGIWAYADNNIKNDVALITLDIAGKQKYLTLIDGGAENDGASTAAKSAGIAANSNGQIYLVGRTNSDNFRVTANAIQTTRRGGNDAFITVMLPPAPTFMVNGRITDTTNTPAIGVQLLLTNTNGFSATTNTQANGFYTFTGIFTGSYHLTPQASNVIFTPTQRIITLTNRNLTGQNFIMPVPDLDLNVIALEVTQAVQDLNNSVELVANKRTFVRFHVNASKSGLHRTFAQLQVTKGATNTILLDPINGNNGHIDVRRFPKRIILDQSFLFELPTSFTQGTITLEATLNPTSTFRGHNPIETTYNNNIMSTTVTFDNVPPANVLYYQLGYFYHDSQQIKHQPAPTNTEELTQTSDLLLRMFPIHKVVEQERRLTNFGPFLLSADPIHIDLGINCMRVNLWLYEVQKLDFLSLNVPVGTRYYAFTNDVPGLGYFRFGCAIPPTLFPKGGVANGPFVSIKKHVHEFGHTYYRFHVEGCALKPPPLNNDYPYNGGDISPTSDRDDPTALFGFDSATQEPYPPIFKDIMSYCPTKQQWISDHHYEKIKSVFENPLFPTSAQSISTITDTLTISGIIIPTPTLQTEFRPAYQLTLSQTQPLLPGDYNILFRDQTHTILAQHAFSPTLAYTDEGIEYLLISEQLPYVTGTVRIDIEDVNKTAVMSITAGINPPSVTLQSPNGGELLTSDTLTLTWAATDPDGDSLFYMVQYSTDNGNTWRVMALDYISTTLVLDAQSIPASNQALWRVLATDGIHTSNDQSDAIMTVPNHLPQARIIHPNAPQTIATQQTITFITNAFDPDSGTLADENIQWSSNLDGPLGQGQQLAISGLNIGIHTILLTASDDRGGIVTDTVTITVKANVGSLPPVPDKLLAGPTYIRLQSSNDTITDTLFLDNQNTSKPLNWQTDFNAPWLVLTPTTGTTPDTAVVAFANTLPDGTYTTTITVTNPFAPLSAPSTIFVEALVCHAPIAPTTTIALSNSHILLTWADTYTIYELWPTPAPYFNPSSSSPITPTLITETTYLDSIPVSVAQPQFYLLRSRKLCGTPSTNTSLQGAFTFALKGTS